MANTLSNWVSGQFSSALDSSSLDICALLPVVGHILVSVKFSKSSKVDLSTVERKMEMPSLSI